MFGRHVPTRSDPTPRISSDRTATDRNNDRPADGNSSDGDGNGDGGDNPGEPEDDPPHDNNPPHNEHPDNFDQELHNNLTEAISALAHNIQQNQGDRSRSKV